MFSQSRFSMVFPNCISAFDRVYPGGPCRWLQIGWRLYAAGSKRYFLTASQRTDCAIRTWGLLSRWRS